MKIIEKFDDGEICFVAGETNKPEVSKNFYVSVLGWDAQNHSSGEYLVFRTQAKQVAVISDRRAFDVPDFEDPAPVAKWRPYIYFNDLRQVSDKAEELGAQFVGARDFDHGGVIQTFDDPQGASFRLWQPERIIGSPLRDCQGAICWHELITADVGASKKFYESLFGWKVSNISSAGQEYTVFQNGKTNVAGLVSHSGTKGAHWLIYFQVDDLETTLGKVAQAMGKIKQQIVEVKGLGKKAIIEDPLGLSFGLVQKESPSPIIGY